VRILVKEDFERAISSAEKQSSSFRAEQVAMRAALEELKRMREGHEVDDTLYEELYQKYSQRLMEVNEKAEEYRRITQSLRNIAKYERELAQLRESQQEFAERLDKTESKLDEERRKVMEMAERFGVVLGHYEERPAPPITREAPVETKPSAPSSREVAQAESEIERLRKEILTELERVKLQTKK
jgi:chromosome segregation ATPase